MDPNAFIPSGRAAPPRTSGFTAKPGPGAACDPFDLLPTPTVVLAADGEVLAANLAWREDPSLGGAAPGGALHHHYARALGGRRGPAAWSVVQRCLRDATPRAEVVPWHAVGIERWLSVEATPVGPDRTLVEHRDVTAHHLAARRAFIDDGLRRRGDPRRLGETLRWLCAVMGWCLAAVWRDEGTGLSLAGAHPELPRGAAKRVALCDPDGVATLAWRSGAPARASLLSRAERAVLQLHLREREREVCGVIAVPCTDGALTFYTSVDRGPDSELLALIAAHLGGAPRGAGDVEVPLSQGVAHEVALGSRAPTLVYGERATGRRSFARALHERGVSAEGPLLLWPRDATLPELAGVDRHDGGGPRRSPGALERASGGTLLIEDLAALPADLQRWLGDAMTEGCFTPVGGCDPLPLRARIIACADAPPEALRDAGVDPTLLDRLCAVVVRIPPLRERRHELHTLAAQTLSRIAQAWQLPPPALSDDAVQAIVAAAWPGNFRELRLALERAWMGVGHTITAASLAAARVTAAQRSAPPPPVTGEPTGDARLSTSERAHVERVLRQTDARMSEAARVLGISRSTLYARVRAWGIDLEAMRAS